MKINKYIFILIISFLLLSFNSYGSVFYKYIVYEISEDEIINEDMYIFAKEININGTVNGDVFVFGEKITINGNINGNLYCAGATIELTGGVENDFFGVAGTITADGDIGDDLRLAGRTVYFNGQTGEDAIIAAIQADTDESSHIGGKGIFAARTLTTKGHIAGELITGVERIYLGGTIDGDTHIRCNYLDPDTNLNIGGNLIYQKPEPITLPQAAKIAGAIQHTMTEPEKSFVAIIGAAAASVFFFFMIIYRIISFFALSLLGILCIALFPKPSATVMKTITTKFWWSTLTGLILLISLPIISILFISTVIGLPLGILGLMLYLISLYTAPIFVGGCIGQMVTRAGKPLTRGKLIGCFFIGYILIYILRLIPFFNIGTLVAIFVGIIGMGSLTICLASKARAASEEPQE
jgi:hypothetical protein